MPFEGLIFNDFKRDGQRASFHARNVIERGKYKRNKRGIRRLYLILLKLEALVYYRHSLVALCKDYVDYLNNFFEIIRDPVVSVHEVESLLRSIFDDPFNDDAINQICHDFLLLFADSAQKYKPRTLKHLSRCSVRKSLQKTGNLQNLVFKLPVPDSIKDYILVFDMVWQRPVPELESSFTANPDEASTMKYC